jgi:hypothetical protein
MLKRIYIPLILALVAALTFSNVAYAAADSATAKTYIRRVGTILSVDTSANTIRVATTKGERMTFHVNSGTAYRGNASSFADLATSMKVNITAQETTSGYYLATLVNAINSQVKVKVKGNVTYVGSNSFTILGIDGNTYSFTITKNTTFSGYDVTDITGLAVGMTAKVIYTKSGDLLRALSVVVTAVNVKIDGKVTKIGSSTFTILATDGSTYVFQVTSNTTFTGKGVDSFSELTKGMKVRVTYTVRDDGTLRAVKVVVLKLKSE